MTKEPQLHAAAVLAVLIHGGTRAQDPAFPVQLLRPLTRVVLDLASVGHTKAADDLRAVLTDLGYPAKLGASLARRQARVGVPRRPRSSRLPLIVKSLVSITNRLSKQLPGYADAKQRHRVAHVLLRIDHELRIAHRALGRARLAGRWVTAATKVLAPRGAEIQNALQQIRKLSPEVKVEKSSHPLLRHVRGRDGHLVSSCGLVVHTCWPVPKTRRLVQNLVRAVAFSKFLIRGGAIELPRNLRHVSVLFTGKPHYRKALAHDRSSGQITAKRAARSDSMAAYYRNDGTLVNNRTMENHALGGIFAHISDVVGSRLHGAADHPTLIVGHGNWVLMALTGAHLPGIAYTKIEKASGTSANPQPDERVELLGAGLMGARSWLRHKVATRSDPAWSRSFKNEVGEIEGIDMLKTTFVAEYLHLHGPLAPVLDKSRRGVGKSTSEIIASLELGLSTELHEFERRWREWMRGLDTTRTSILARLNGTSSSTSKAERQVRAYLKRVRTAAHTHPFLGRLPPVTLDRSLSDNALLHARYLERHRDQLAKWPDAHEEFTDREGFTAAGCWAGNHSVIAPGVQTPRQALDAWMGTFFHRLPLLDPGLLRVGWGLAGTTAVLDSGSMVRILDYEWEVTWPPNGGRDVPRRFVAELPNPFPGEDQSTWGFPITLQLGPRKNGGAPTIAMKLRSGSAQGTIVPCRLSTPQTPGNPLLAPALTWCLIPRAPLRTGTSYHVEAVFGGGKSRTLRWSFRTR